MSSPAAQDLRAERKLVAVIAAVQLVNVLDFVMVMPMGPDFAVALHIDMSHLGAIGGAYTAAAAAAGLVGSTFLDRYDRRTALLWSMLGLALGTLAGGFAWDLPSLLVTRVVAGLFGGPATSIGMAIVSDCVPPERRGRAMGAVMGSFSLASIVGVPVGLELARQGGWRFPFLVIGALCAVVAVLARWVLPAMQGHVAKARENPVQLSQALGILLRRDYWLCYLMGTSAAMSAFLLIPNLSAYTQYNLGLPRPELGTLYLYGGLASLVTMVGTGRLVDRFGALGVTVASVVLFFGVLWSAFWSWTGAVGAVWVFVPFFVSNSARNVAFNATVTKVPTPHERARFMSAMSAVQHFSAAAGSFLSGAMIAERADHGLDGVQAVAVAAFAIGATLPLWLGLVERRLRAAGVAVGRSRSA